MTLRELKDIAAVARAQIRLNARLQESEARNFQNRLNVYKARAIINDLPGRLLVAARKGQTGYSIREAAWPYSPDNMLQVSPSDEVALLVWGYCQRRGWNPEVSDAYVANGRFQLKRVCAIRIELC
jgi:hypothetical protein